MMDTQLVVSSLEVMLITVMVIGLALAGCGLWISFHQDKFS